MTEHSITSLPSLLTRRALLVVTPALIAAAGVATRGVTTTRAQPVESTERGDMPTTGGLRPGPVGMEPATARRKGVEPAQIKIEVAQVDSPVEVQPIIDGVMQNPSGPYVVSWYRGTGKLNEGNNIVMAGHLDYYDVGQAVFFHLGKLKEGDTIEVTGKDDQVYAYMVEWNQEYVLADLDAAQIQDLVGSKDEEVVTLITCSGAFDAEAQQYTQRRIVRAKRAE